MKFSELKTDKKLETEGVWFGFAEDTDFRIARMSPKYSDAVARVLGKGSVRAIQRGAINSSKLRKKLAPVIAKYLFLDWRGVEDETTGKELAYTTEEAESILLKYVEVYDFIIECANDAECYRVGDESVGNSETSLDGSSNGDLN